QDLGARRDIFEAELALTPDEMLGHAAQIARRLVRKARERRALGLRLDYAAEDAADEQGIVDRAGCGREFAHRNAEAGAAVHLLAGLDEPAGLLQLFVDGRPCAVFGVENAYPRDRLPA